MDSTECLLVRWWQDSAFTYRLVWVDFLYIVCAKRPSCLLHVNVQEGKVAVWLILHNELDTGMNVGEVVKEIIQLLWPMRPDHNCVIHVTKPASGFWAPATCHLLRDLHEEVSYHRWQWWAHGNSVHLWNWPMKQKNKELRTWWKSLVAFIKLPTQKIQGIPNWHPYEERDNVKAD